MKSKEMMTKVVAVVLLVVFAVVSFAGLAKTAADTMTYSHTIESIDDKKATVMTLTATAAAASTALAAVPGDLTNPIAGQIMEISEYLFIVVCFLVLEKSLLTVMGVMSFKILIPAACALMAGYILLKRPGLKILALKLAVFALVVVFLIPMSVGIGDMIYEVNKATVEELTELETETVPVETTEPVAQTVPESEPTEDRGWFGNLVSGITDTVENATEKVGEAAQNVVDKVGQSAADTLEEAKELLNSFVDAIALFVITYCAIPVIVVLVMVWVVKFLFQVQIPVPQKAMKPFAKNKKIDAEETALVEV